MSALRDEDEGTIFQPAGTAAAAATPRGVEGATPGPWGSGLPAGTLLNNIYEVRRFLARGGMGEVYEGVNVNTDERVAIKVVLPHLAADPKVQAMFRKEARILTELAHPALVRYRVLAFEPKLELFYIVTEFIDGRSLSELLGDLRPSTDDLRALVRRLAEGLGAAHALGAIHRDMSPDNVLLPGGRLDLAKIIDFGIARESNLAHHTVVGDGFAGKLGYVAPEQFGDFGRRIGPWTDIYSLGLVVLALASNRAPDMGVTLVDAVDRRREGVDLNPLPAPLRPLFQRMLAPDPSDRFQTMAEVIEALDHPEGDAPPIPSTTPPAAAAAAAPAEAPAADPQPVPPVADTAADEPEAPRRALKPWLLGLGGLGAVCCLGLGITIAAGPKRTAQTEAIAPIQPIVEPPHATAIAEPLGGLETAPPLEAALAPPPAATAPPAPVMPRPKAAAAAVQVVRAPEPTVVAAAPAIEAPTAVQHAPPAAEPQAPARAEAATPAAAGDVEACWREAGGGWTYIGYSSRQGCAGQVFASCQVTYGRWGKNLLRRYDGKLQAKGSGPLAGWRTIGASQCSAAAK